MIDKHKALGLFLITLIMGSLSAMSSKQSHISISYSKDNTCPLLIAYNTKQNPKEHKQVAMLKPGQKADIDVSIYQDVDDFWFAGETKNSTWHSVTRSSQTWHKRMWQNKQRSDISPSSLLNYNLCMQVNITPKKLHQNMPFKSIVESVLPYNVQRSQPKAIATSGVKSTRDTIDLAAKVKEKKQLVQTWKNDANKLMQFLDQEPTLKKISTKTSLILALKDTQKHLNELFDYFIQLNPDEFASELAGQPSQTQSKPLMVLEKADFRCNIINCSIEALEELVRRKKDSLLDLQKATLRVRQAGNRLAQLAQNKNIAVAMDTTNDIKAKKNIQNLKSVLSDLKLNKMSLIRVQKGIERLRYYSWS